MKPSAFALGLLVGFAACSASADTITDWNKTTHDVMRAANVASNPASRALAMVHVAMSDAVNGVQRLNGPIRTNRCQCPCRYPRDAVGS